MLALMLAPMFMPGGVKTGENRRAAGKDFAPPSRIQSGRHRAARPLLAAPMLFFCCWVEVKNHVCSQACCGCGPSVTLCGAGRAIWRGIGGGLRLVRFSGGGVRRGGG